jgi:hypothetical protein
MCKDKWRDLRYFFIVSYLQRRFQYSEYMASRGRLTDELETICYSWSFFNHPTIRHYI